MTDKNTSPCIGIDLGGTAISSKLVFKAQGADVGKRLHHFGELMHRAKEDLFEWVTPSLIKGLDVLQETGRNDAGMLGAGHLIFQKFDENGISTD